MSTSEGRQADHIRFIERSIELADEAVAAGNHPFGALLVDYAPEGPRVVLEARNTVNTEHDVTRHAELNAVSQAAKTQETFDRPLTLYTSTEPCCMCCGAIYWWGRVGTVVFACSEQRLGKITAASTDAITRSIGMDIPCREVFSRALPRIGKPDEPPVAVIGPLLEDRAAKAHTAYWS